MKNDTRNGNNKRKKGNTKSEIKFGQLLVNFDKKDSADYEVLDLIKLDGERKVSFQEAFFFFSYNYAFRDLVYTTCSLSKKQEVVKIVYPAYFFILNEYLYTSFGALLDLYLTSVLFKGNNLLPMQYVNDETDIMLFRYINFFYYNYSKGILWDLDKNRFINESLSRQKKVLGLSLYKSLLNDSYYVDEDLLKRNSRFATFGLNWVVKYFVNFLADNQRLVYFRDNFSDTNEFYFEFSEPYKEKTNLYFQKSDNNKLKSFESDISIDLFYYNRLNKNLSLYIDKCLMFEISFDLNSENIKKVLFQSKNILKEYFCKELKIEEHQDPLESGINYYFIKNYEKIKKHLDDKYGVENSIKGLYKDLEITDDSFQDSYISEKVLIMNLYYIYLIYDIYIYFSKELNNDKDFLFVDIKKLKILRKKLV